MKRLFSLLSLMLVLLTSCENTQESGETTLTSLSESLMEFDFRGGKGMVLFEVKNPKTDVTLTVSANGATWISDIKSNDSVASFVVERNGGTDDEPGI